MIRKRIRTNLITGFLGAGKTTLIQSLLQVKPEGETWAVLVNEFGEVGIDAGLLNGSNASAEVMIKEVAGGCLCCAAGVPMQVAINQIIQKTNPDRLLIEPTGLGHPAEIAKVLSNEYNQRVLQLHKTICVVDARKLKNSSYTHNVNFNQQIDIADVVYASKADLYQQADFTNLCDYLADDKKTIINSDSAAAINDVFAEINQIPFMKASDAVNSINSPSYLKPSTTLLEPSVFSEVEQGFASEFNSQGFVTKSNQGEGAYSIGWIFSAELCFDFDRLIVWCDSLLNTVIRIKAVMITEEGIAGFNAVDGKLSITELDETMDSRLEIISLKPIEQALLSEQILSCIDRG
ncbi:CobW family GTP-binding protein [Shewanella donghaensis]|uniref:CobW family GTP-binding protein n=1 Tax=Shewanella donghaensis TaxID=238836 RepID=UPI001182A39B|nr:GTP-binding protein [Shewanella donghaensis]